MECPYCKKEMSAGVIFGNGGGSVCWKDGRDELPRFSEKVFNKKKIEAADYFVDFPALFTINADYCENCKIMMFKTEISNR